MPTGKPGFDQLRGLLDVQLDKGFDDPASRLALPPPHSVDVRAAFRHVLGKGAARVDTLCLERSRREHPEGRATADVGDLEPDTFLGPNCHGSDVAAAAADRAVAGL